MLDGELGSMWLPSKHMLTASVPTQEIVTLVNGPNVVGGDEPGSLVFKDREFEGTQVTNKYQYPKIVMSA